MNSIIEKINKIQLPKACFNLVLDEDGESVDLIPIDQIKLLSDDDVLSQMINDAYSKGSWYLEFSPRHGKYELRTEQLAEAVFERMRNLMINLWCKANKKVEFRRTKFYDKYCDAIRNVQLKEQIISLYIDCVKYGIKEELSDKESPVTPMQKFFANKFQEVVLSYGR